jgi:hypothetical protein
VPHRGYLTGQSRPADYSRSATEPYYNKTPAVRLMAAVNGFVLSQQLVGLCWCLISEDVAVWITYLEGCLRVSSLNA